MSHFLKRLELNGFKSFADRTVLEFPAGIVAIVGPNGSGKSNVVDALRWLLGERDAKNLRGGKGEDLIFAGTQKRARVGQAQASLYFDNTSKFFPVDFEEVVVSREIRRDGQNKYFLNRSEVLLRDLVDFFAKARLGSRGLVIIGQGDSDLFVRSTPLERRAMIEEILGLREYQIKKSDAERRLRTTRVNLEKVQALIEEIVPHLRSLKRQTGRWEHRSELETELRTLEDQFFGYHLRELRAKKEITDKNIEAESARRRTLERTLKEAHDRQSMIEGSRPEEQKDLMNIKEEMRLLTEKKNLLQKDIGRLEARIEMAKTVPSHAESRSPEKLLSLVKRIQAELRSALEGGDMGALHARLPGILKEIDGIVADQPDEKKSAVPDELTQSLVAVTNDLRSLDLTIGALREREWSLETGQEAFYQNFKSAVQGVQSAKDAIDAWERGNREQALEAERIALHREEIVRQIEQAGRRLSDFSFSEPSSSETPETSETPKPETSLAEVDVSAVGLAEVERRMFKLRGDLASIGEVDQTLVTEARETENRHAFLVKESEDLSNAVADLVNLMAKLTEKIATEFEGSLHTINKELEKFFEMMFGGGTAKLKLETRNSKPETSEGETAEEIIKGENEGEPTAGIEIEIKIPRKKISSLDMLSGGERSLVGIAALFALVSVSPPPFLVLDEIDAPLDERNARRFAEMLKNFSKRTQFVVVTHNRATMEAADILYGVTLHEDGSSKLLSVKLEDRS